MLYTAVVELLENIKKGSFLFKTTGQASSQFWLIVSSSARGVMRRKLSDLFHAVMAKIHQRCYGYSRGGRGGGGGY